LYPGLKPVLCRIKSANTDKRYEPVQAKSATLEVIVMVEGAVAKFVKHCLR